MSPLTGESEPGAAGFRYRQFDRGEYRQAAGAGAGSQSPSQSAIQCLLVEPRTSLIRFTMRVTSRSALKKAVEVMPDVRKKAVALLLAWARSA